MYIYYESNDQLVGEGQIVFDPLPVKKGVKDSFKPWWVIIQISGEIDEYYSWFIKRHHGIRLIKPLWGAHISLVRGEKVSVDLWNQLKQKYQSKAIKFLYSVSPRTNGAHWWLPVECPFLSDLRKELALEPLPKFNFHLTIGTSYIYHEDLSYDVWRMYKKILNLPED